MTTGDSMPVFLETGRLILRRFTERDIDLLVELDSDPDVMRFITGGQATPSYNRELWMHQLIEGAAYLPR